MEKPKQYLPSSNLCIHVYTSMSVFYFLNNQKHIFEKVFLTATDCPSEQIIHISLKLH